MISRHRPRKAHATTDQGPARPRGVGSAATRSSFWAGMIMGAATATGGYFALKALERAFGKTGQPGNNALTENPGHPPRSEAHQRLIASATGGTAALPPAKPPVKKRTIIEEMVEDLDE